MKIKNFLDTLTNPSPDSSFTEELVALWHAKRGDWDKAHTIAQDINNSNGSWIHAYLHRYEGDEANARYWYRLAGKKYPSVTLDQELNELIEYFLQFQDNSGGAKNA